MVENGNSGSSLSVTLWRATLASTLAMLVVMSSQASVDIANAPLSVGGAAIPPLNMIVMGRDHTLYYEAYNDASDLNGDGVLNVGYEPGKVDYFGYFDSGLCYAHSGGRFDPVAVANGKKCSGGGHWSGDFLNYLTTARIDALRKVLYGGRRIVDTEALTVLERAYVPQDAHSWGKEYTSIARDGFDIRDYSPLSLPSPGTRHLFANTSLLKNDVLAPNRSADMAPLLRVLTDSRFRIWEWVAIERHVAGSRCVDGQNNNNPCVYPAQTVRADHAQSAGAFQNLVDSFGISDQRCGSGPISGGQINTSGSDNNPFASAPHCGHDYYLTRIQGQIYAAVDGHYQFATNGDDALEFRIDGEVVSHWYGGHGQKWGSASEIAAAVANENLAHNGTVFLSEGWHDFEYRHQERTGGDSYQLLWRRPGQSWEWVPSSALRGPEGSAYSVPLITTFSIERTLPASVMTDYPVRVRVCDSDFPEKHCKAYPAGTVKPTGLLQEYGEDDRMLFGLITGSFTHPYNMRGGVLRKNIESFSDEVDADTGIFANDLVGIVGTLDRFRIVDFDQGSNYQYHGGWLVNAPMSESNTAFPDWGNPIAEMMYENLRYFSGKGAPTTQFMPPLNNGMERVRLRHHGGDQYMYLPAPEWQDPYTRGDIPAYWCSPGAQMLISDVNPSYDTEYVPGSIFSAFSGDIAGLHAASEANAIWAEEHGGTGIHFIGQSGSDYDGAPSAKSVSGLGNIRGLSPSEPTKQGGYYSSAIARFGFRNDLRADLEDEQNIHTFSVALASPLPRIEIPVNGNLVTLVPFGKTVAAGGMNNARGSFQPTNSIVDFFVETFANTDPLGSDADPELNQGRPYVRFRINFEDVEQGADHDMDAIIVYELQVRADGMVDVQLVREYEAAGYTMNYGYVISGTTADGVYLDVSSKPSNPAYFLNTPPGMAPGACDFLPVPSGCGNVPQTANRSFTPSAGGDTATLLENPLWYAAKYGSTGSEGLAPGETSPNYFLVTNASTLQRQLEEAFERVLMLAETSSTAAATSSAVLQSDTLLYAAAYRTTDWSGRLRAFEVLPEGKVGTIAWDAEQLLAARLPGSRRIFTMSRADLAEAGIPVPLSFGELSEPQQFALDHDALGVNDGLGGARVSWLRGVEDEQPGFRRRTVGSEKRLLGDIVNGDPQFMGKRDFGYSYFEGTIGDAYRAFRASIEYNSRPATLFVPANNGMLHAFDAVSGQELFAYVPGELLLAEPGRDHARISRLMMPNYDHRYFLDGTPTVEDAYIDGKWRTILVGSMGMGGRTVFALDATNPGAFDEGSVLWEFTHPDLGYGVSAPRIGRLASGEWVAIFGNGYNSNGHRSALFVVRLEDGELLRVIATGAGSGAQPNGLATPAISDWLEFDLRARFAFAGDLLGNLWRFELWDSDPEKWDVHRVFTAVDPDDVRQPITVQPVLARNRLDSSQLLILFGTGSYFRVQDANPENFQVQTLYGIVDGSEVAGRLELLEQEIVWSYDGMEETSANAQAGAERGWFLDLAKNGVSDGERVVSVAAFPPGPRRERVLFASMVPNPDPCSGGVDGRYTDLRIATGARHDHPVFDINADGVIDEDDVVSHMGEDRIVNRILGGGGEMPRVLRDPPGGGGPTGLLIHGGIDEDDDLQRILGSGRDAGRQSWRQLR